eukprot:TRINITY_DN19982_c0_g1_i1.p1 TRINITY_DN19982_c0_g1~~TRINITY_DN19982_c0_g1_i1.p1  ORF type:complete len:655 (-),score=67.53 TRINITY_DN19982_c0_g1_i1:23-1987(-)
MLTMIGEIEWGALTSSVGTSPGSHHKSEKHLTEGDLVWMYAAITFFTVLLGLVLIIRSSFLWLEGGDEDALNDNLVEKYGRRDGQALTRRVPPQHWGVTRADIRTLRRSIVKAVERGDIMPTTSDPFDVTDDVVGPNIHTVVKQYIKPLTEKAGGMSWALMKHNDGVEVDLFITHAWVEGSYELFDKIDASWPIGAKHAYICCLANPQNNSEFINSLVAVPSESPFALALRNSTKMLVIPNSKCSIYSRMWCVYEAYLANRWNKTIIEGHGAILQPFLAKVLPWIVLFTWLGVVLASLAIFLLGTDRFMCTRQRYKWRVFWDISCLRSFVQRGNLIFSVFTILLWIIILNRSSFYKMILNLVFALWVGVVLTVVIAFLLLGGESYDCPIHYYNVLNPNYKWSWWYTLFVLSQFGFCATAGYDRVVDSVAKKEARKLRKGYTGDVLQASCSCQRDQEAIVSEIGDEAPSVNRCVDLLMMAHMASSDLREASSQGVYLAYAGVVRSSIVYISYLLWWAILWHHGEWVPWRKVLESLPLFAWAGIFFLSTTADRKAFASMALLKLLIIPACVLIYAEEARFGSLILNLDGFERWTHYLHRLDRWTVLVDCCGLLVVAVSYVSIGLICRIPFLGPLLVQHIMQSAACKMCLSSDKTAD